MELEDIQRQIDQVVNSRNHRALPEFEGYSPFEMHRILHFTFEEHCPVQLKKLAEPQYKKIPIFAQIKYLLDLLAEKGEIKLTQKGYLPTKIVSDLYRQGFLKDRYIEEGWRKLYKETDSMIINLTRILAQISGLTRKRKGKLNLTRKGEKLIADHDALMRMIFRTFGSKFNWAYYDAYGENYIGQLGYGFTLILLGKYGSNERKDAFYAGKYFNAFPHLLESVEPSYDTFERYTTSCFSIRTFERFLDYFGLIELEKEGTWSDEVIHVKKTSLFDELITIHPHREAY